MECVDPARVWRPGARRSTYHYKFRRPDQAGLEARIKEICATRVRYGYRRVHVLLCREGRDVKIKKGYRIYREFGLQLRNKTPKRGVKAKLRDDRMPATAPNETWAMDWRCHDNLAVRGDPPIRGNERSARQLQAPSLSAADHRARRLALLPISAQPAARRRDVAAARDIVSYETIRRWAMKFGPDYASRLKRKRPGRHD